MFIVTILHKQLSTYEIYLPDGKYAVAQVDKRVPDIDTDEIPDFNIEVLSRHRGTFLFGKETSAKDFAAALAAARPDCQVVWGALQGAFESVPSTPVEKSITAKGILPV